MPVIRFTYFYKRRKLSSHENSVKDPYLTIPFLLPSTERKKAHVSKRGFFIKKKKCSFQLEVEGIILD
jgi:hypothetical protein